MEPPDLCLECLRGPECSRRAVCPGKSIWEQRVHVSSKVKINRRTQPDLPSATSKVPMENGRGRHGEGAGSPVLRPWALCCVPALPPPALPPPPLPPPALPAAALPAPALPLPAVLPGTQWHPEQSGCSSPEQITVLMDSLAPAELPPGQQLRYSTLRAFPYEL